MNDFSFLTNAINTAAQQYNSIRKTFWGKNHNIQTKAELHKRCVEVQANYVSKARTSELLWG